MTITEMRTMRANHPNQFWSEWVKRDPNSLAMARIRVSYEDTRTLLQRAKRGQIDRITANRAKGNHTQLLQRMLQKNWVSELDVKQYIIY